MDRTVRIPTALATALAVALLMPLRAPSGAWADMAWGQDPSTRDSVLRQAAEFTPAMVEAEIERRFNDLRTDVLATQASALQWWMRMTAMLLTFFVVAVPVFGFLGFNRFREIERDTRHSAAAVAQAAEATKRYMAEMKAARSHTVERGGREEWVPVDPGASSAERDPMACLARGTARADAGRHEEAIAEYDEAIRLSGGIDGVAYHNRGASCLSLGRHEEAIADYDAAIRLDAMDAAAYVMRGFAKAEMGRTEEAIADYSESIRLQPRDVLAFLNRARAKWDTGRHEEAIADFDVAIRMEPKDGGTWLARGIVKREAGMRDEARQDLESALTLAQAAGDGPLAARVEKFLRSWRG